MSENSNVFCHLRGFSADSSKMGRRFSKSFFSCQPSATCCIESYSTIFSTLANVEENWFFRTLISECSTNDVSWFPNAELVRVFSQIKAIFNDISLALLGRRLAIEHSTIEIRWKLEDARGRSSWVVRTRSGARPIDPRRSDWIETKPSILGGPTQNKYLICQLYVIKYSMCVIRVCIRWPLCMFTVCVIKCMPLYGLGLLGVSVLFISSVSSCFHCTYQIIPLYELWSRLY